MTETVKTIYRKDYRQPDFLVSRVELDFELFEEETLVTSRLQIERNGEQSSLVLDGLELELLELAVDGEVLNQEQYRQTDTGLEIFTVPDNFQLSCKTRIYPHKNTSLEGLYKSRLMFCTQCEAEGFRKITFFPDRPDVMAEYTVSIEADKNRYPLLLSNGNKMSQQDLPEGRHKVTWHDPFPKPSYLFALVAGDLAVLTDTFTTQSGREVQLNIYVEQKDLGKIDYAMDALKRSMRWDEEVYGREYDLDLFNIVAVDDFNMGAMENKSLNIFNTSCVLAHPDTTTDAGFQRVEAVVAHEYFHNWSGNRVTCRDWFQLSLKEGFTVFRDSQFSADMNSATIKRVEDVTLLRSLQFAEDAGPMAHPVRPDSFIDISNFYTLTVYEKGAEVVRMIANILGPEDFRKGSDLYFERFDGQAVTCEDFVVSMEEASGKDLSQFRNWYSQAGTPKLEVYPEWNEQQGTYALTFKQSCAPSPGQAEKLPFHIPVKISLLGDAGAYRLDIQGQQSSPDTDDNTELTLDITLAEQTIVFQNLPEEPVPSLLRGFSAPVKLEFPYSRQKLAFLITRDNDGFNRWDACQQLAVSVIRDIVSALQQGEDVRIDPALQEALLAVMQDPTLDPAMVAHMLKLPSESYLGEQFECIDVFAIHQARQLLQQHLAEQLAAPMRLAYQNNAQNSTAVDAGAMATRSLKNSALFYLALLGEEALPLLEAQYTEAVNMTDRFAALSALVHSENALFNEAAEQALDMFYARYCDESLVVNQWLQVQCSNPYGDGLLRLQGLMEHPAFDFNNPNKLRATLGAFAATHNQFHRKDGAAYAFYAEQILKLNHSNPQIASRLLAPLTRWKRYLPEQGEQMRAQLQRLLDSGELARDVYEVVSKSLL